VQLDKDENVVLEENNLQIMIRWQTIINWWRIQTIFKTLDGANIKAVEIIANPSAKYDAAGSAGILIS
jgi:NADH:ubiquinone oxidoreductase subunit B-like Fe-S oxidoreductase